MDGLVFQNQLDIRSSIYQVHWKVVVLTLREQILENLIIFFAQR